jgi:hypothetical protein
MHMHMSHSWSLKLSASLLLRHLVSRQGRRAALLANPMLPRVASNDAVKPHVHPDSWAPHTQPSLLATPSRLILTRWIVATPSPRRAGRPPQPLDVDLMFPSHSMHATGSYTQEEREHARWGQPLEGERACDPLPPSQIVGGSVVRSADLDRRGAARRSGARRRLGQSGRPAHSGRDVRAGALTH